MRKGLKIPVQVFLPAQETISQREILEELKITKMTLKNYRDMRNFPPPVERDGKCNRYRTSEVVQFCKSNGSEVVIYGR
ncbi:helix-turn-helix transcriptional regulator [Paracoccus haematequi]|uniref:helix-turn-helix transcriptional regulator n=1 Tax=Paracoccus haematequi TaxID=2491866 RepID=UPI000F7E6D75|nr:hypothetical protein [Paracoccus haematequi]